MGDTFHGAGFPDSRGQIGMLGVMNVADACTFSHETINFKRLSSIAFKASWYNGTSVQRLLFGVKQ